MAEGPSRPSGNDADHDSNINTAWTVLAEAELTMAHAYHHVKSNAADDAQQLVNDTAGLSTQVGAISRADFMRALT